MINNLSSFRFVSSRNTVTLFWCPNWTSFYTLGRFHQTLGHSVRPKIHYSISPTKCKLNLCAVCQKFVCKNLPKAVCHLPNLCTKKAYPVHAKKLRANGVELLRSKYKRSRRKLSFRLTDFVWGLKVDIEDQALSQQKMNWVLRLTLTNVL